MKMLVVIALLALSSSAIATETGSDSNISRYVADVIEIETMSNGEVVTRLVSRSKLSARQFWITSVYRSREPMLVFEGRSSTTQHLGDIYRGQESERQILQGNRAINNLLDFPIHSAVESK